MKIELWNVIDYDRVELTEIGVKIDNAINNHCKNFKISRCKLVKADYQLIADNLDNNIKQGHIKKILDLD